jgi:hypothetical protein
MKSELRHLFLKTKLSFFLSTKAIAKGIPFNLLLQTLFSSKVGPDLSPQELGDFLN